MRRVDCKACGVIVEAVPWADDKHQLTKAYMLFLARWARKLSWKETAQSFRTSWDQVCHAVEYVVEWGLQHRTLAPISAIGVDEIQFAKGHKYLTLVYQIDAGATRLLAEAVPEDNWSFKPTEGAFTDARTFAEQVKHVACGNEAWAKKLRGEQSPAHSDTGGPNPARTQAEILAYLRQSFDMMDREIPATRLGNLMDPVRGPSAGGNRFEVLTSALWHISDHMANWSSTRT
jgi:hypothetical protein